MTAVAKAGPRAVLMAAALALTACGGQTKPAAAVSSSPAPPAKGEKPTREFVVGKWGTNGDCTLAIDLRPDGTSDGPFGNWTYDDGTIGFVDEKDFKVHVTVLDDNTMESTNDQSDKTSRMTRCP